MHLFSKIVNTIEDYRLGIRAGGTAQTHKPGAVYYASISHKRTREILDRLKFSMSDEFIDIGCGKGRVLAIASTYSVGTIVGVEYEPSLAKLARVNTARLEHPRISVWQGAAEDFDYSKITVAYAFNPVEPEILDLILAKIERDLAASSTAGAFRIVYVMESPAQRAVFEAHSWLQRYDSFTNADGHAISFYRSIISGSFN
jgi:cyclopropane fatty-acyl-phospholipid synthase-like methyltransferase